jgi:hypothetical protein
METPAEMLTASQRYYRAHRVQRQQYGRDYYARNREAILAAAAAKREAERPHPEPVNFEMLPPVRFGVYVEHDRTISFS